jgi:hypothetical protein
MKVYTSNQAFTGIEEGGECFEIHLTKKAVIDLEFYAEEFCRSPELQLEYFLKSTIALMAQYRADRKHR